MIADLTESIGGAFIESPGGVRGEPIERLGSVSARCWIPLSSPGVFTYEIPIDLTINAEVQAALVRGLDYLYNIVDMDRVPDNVRIAMDFWDFPTGNPPQNLGGCNYVVGATGTNMPSTFSGWGINAVARFAGDTFYAGFMPHGNDAWFFVQRDIFRFSTARDYRFIQLNGTRFGWPGDLFGPVGCATIQSYNNAPTDTGPILHAEAGELVVIPQPTALIAGYPFYARFYTTIELL